MNESSETNEYLKTFPVLPQASNSSRSNGQAVIVNAAIAETPIAKRFELIADEYRAKVENAIVKQTLQTIVSRIAHETNTTIEFSVSQCHYVTFVVTGLDANVQKATAKVHQTFYTLPSKVLTIAKRFHKMIVGYKGLKIQEIENLSGAKIRIPQLRDSSETIVISGPLAGIELAEKEINQIVFNIENQTKETIAIAKKFHVFVRGFENRVLNEIGEKTNVRISMPDAATDSEQILLSGFKANVLEAKTKLLELVERLQTGFTNVLMEIPKAQHRHINDTNFIGKILVDFHVNLEVPAPESDSLNVRLTGQIENVANALRFVYEHAISMKFVSIPLDNRCHGYLIGKKGANMQQFKVKYPKSIVRCNKPANQIELTGPVTEIEQFDAEITKIISTVICKEIEIEDRFIGLVIGQNGKNLNRLVDEHSVSIDRLAPETDTGKQLLRIAGDAKNVSETVADVEQLLEKLHDQTTKSLPVERKYLGSLIGKRGANIQKLREQFKTVRIQTIDETSTSGTQATFMIRGPSADVEQVYRRLANEIDDLVAESFSHSIAIDEHLFRYFYNNDLLKMRKLQAEYDVHLDYRCDRKALMVRGKQENVEKIEKFVTKLIADWIDRIVTCELTVPDELHVIVDFMSQDFFSNLAKKHLSVIVDVRDQKLHLIGLNDQIEQIREIFEQSTISCRKIVLDNGRQKAILSRVLRDLSDRNNATSYIVGVSKQQPYEVYALIVGKEKSVADTIDLFEPYMQNIAELHEIVKSMTSEQFQYLTANRKQIINRVTEETGSSAIIDLIKNETNSSRLVVSGCKRDVDAFIAKLNEYLVEFDSFAEKQCEIDPKFHRYVIGARGSNLKRICDEYNVSIKMPERGDDDNTTAALIRVRGLDENCERAIAAMQELLPITEHVTIASELHHLIVGPRGENIRGLRQKFNVHIDVPNGPQHSDEIKITGFKCDVEQAKCALMDLTNEMVMEIEPKWYPRIIGRKGLTIRKLRTEHNVRIVFDNDTNTESQLVRISGPVDGCEAAKSEILRLIEDEY